MATVKTFRSPDTYPRMDMTLPRETMTAKPDIFPANSIGEPCKSNMIQVNCNHLLTRKLQTSDSIKHPAKQYKRVSQDRLVNSLV